MSLFIMDVHELGPHLWEPIAFENADFLEDTEYFQDAVNLTKTSDIKVSIC